MKNLKDVMYAGLGLAKQTETQIKETYDVLVAKGKRVDEEGKNIINDLFKSIEEGKEKLGDKYNEHLTKVEEFISELKNEK